MTTILITGASSGIGAALALAYAGPDVHLVLLARRADRLRGVAQECRRNGAAVTLACLNVCDRKLLEMWIGELDKASPLDIVIANAGISGGTLGLDDNFVCEQENQIFAVNVAGVLNTIHPAIRGMKSRRKGQIVIVSSLAGFFAAPGAPAYAASKAAIRYYGQALAAKLKPYEIYVTVVCPGFVVSEMTQANDFPMPFLISAQRAAALIRKAIEKRQEIYCFPIGATFAVYVLRLLPLSFQSFIFRKFPAKKALANL